MALVGVLGLAMLVGGCVIGALGPVLKVLSASRCCRHQGAGEPICQLLRQPVGLPCSTTLSESWLLFDRERFGTLGRNYDAALSFNQRMLDRGGLVERRIDLITKADVIEHLYAMAAGDTVSAATYGVQVRVFRDFLLFLRERGWLGFEPLFPFNANRAYRQHAIMSQDVV